MPSLTSVMEFRGQLRLHRRHRPASCAWTTSWKATVLLIPGKDGGGDRVRVNARLIAAGTDSQIWAQQFERSLGDTAAMHADIAKAIAAGVNAVVTPDGGAASGSGRAKTNPAANEAYFEGVNYLSQSSSDGQRAVDAFRRATSLDPNHAAAHAGLARGLFTLGFLGSDFASGSPRDGADRSQPGACDSTRTLLKLTPPGRICSSTMTGTGPGPSTRTSARLTSMAVLPAPDRSMRDSSQLRDGARTPFVRPRRRPKLIRRLRARLRRGP